MRFEVAGAGVTDRRVGGFEAGRAPGSAVDGIDQVAEARRQIVAVAPADDHQAEVRRRMMAFADRHPDCLLRSCRPGHFTGSALVVDPGTGRTLLIHHAKLGRWLQPGGHADGVGDLGAVALREAEEETGLADLSLVTPAVDLDVHEIPGRPGEPAHLHLDARFVVLARGGLAPRTNHESLGARWVGADAPEVTASDELARAVTAALRVADELPS